MRRPILSLNKKKKKLLYQLIFSYMIILVIPIIALSLLINQSTIHYSRERIIDSNIMKLQVMQNNIDTYFNEIRNAAITIAGDGRTNAAHTIKRTESAYSYDTVIKAMGVMDLFRETRGLKNYIHSMYLYNQNERLIITSTGGLFHEEEFHDTAWIDSINFDISYEVITTDIRKPVNAIPPENMQQIGVEEDVITFIFPLKYINLKGAVAINVKHKELFGEWQPLSGSSGINLVIDRQGRILYNSQRQEEKDMVLDHGDLITQVNNHENENGYFPYISNDIEFLVTFWKSKGNDLAVIDVVPSGMLFDKIFLFKTMLIAVSASLFLMGLVLSYFISKKVYNPVKGILEGLRGHTLVDGSSKKNELALIQDAVNRLIYKEKEIERIINTNEARVMEARVISLVMGMTREDKGEYSNFEEYNFCLLISVDNYKRFVEDFSVMQQQQMKSAAVSIINNEVSKYAKGYSAVLREGRIVTIVGLQRKHLVGLVQLQKIICDSMLSQIAALNRVSVSISIGRVYRGLNNISVSFSESEKAMEYKFFYGSNCCIHYDEIKNRNEICTYFQDKGNLIVNLLMTNSMEGIREQIHDFIRDTREKKDVNQESVYQTVIYLIGKTMEYLSSTYITVDDIFGESNNVVLEIMEVETLDALETWLCTFYQTITIYLAEYTNRKNDKKFLSQIEEIIENNFMWSDLSIQWIADELNISYSHFRALFKEEIGINFLDYLNKIRIEHAKSLLLHTELTISEIAVKSGYNNDQSFNRFFKKYEGITPGKYRENCMISENVAINIKSYGEI